MVKSTHPSDVKPRLDAHLARRKITMISREEYLYSPETLPRDQLFEDIAHLHEAGATNIAQRLNMKAGTIRTMARRHGREDIAEAIPYEHRSDRARKKEGEEVDDD